MTFKKDLHLIFSFALILIGTVSCIAPNPNAESIKYVDPTSFSSSTTGMFSLRGEVPAFSGFNSTADLNFFQKSINAYAVDCTSLKAGLYKIQTDGTVSGTAYKEVNIGSGGKFSFNLNRANFSNSGNAEYMIATSGSGSSACMQYFSAFVDDLDNPVSVDFISTIITQAITVKALEGKRLSKESLRKFGKKVREDYLYVDNNYTPTNKEIDNFKSGFYNMARNSEAVGFFFNTFGFNYYLLKDSAPTLTTNFPTNFDEMTEVKIQSANFHWNDTYTGVNEWYVDGILYSQDIEFVFTAMKNSKRTLEVVQYLGVDAGSGIVDRNKSFAKKTWNIIINDTYPGLITPTVITDIVTKTKTVNIKVETKEIIYPANKYELCDTFDSFAINVDSLTAPVTYPYECNTILEQFHTIDIPEFYGDHIIRFWLKDQSTDIVVGASFVVRFDDLGPLIGKVLINPTPLNNTGVESTIIKNPNTKIYLEASDDTSITHFKVLDVLASDGSCQDQFSDNNWVLPTDLTGGKFSVDYVMNYVAGAKKICIWGKDILNNISLYPAEVEDTNITSYNFELGEAPEVNFIKITNNIGGGSSYVTSDDAKVEFNLSDLEGLAPNPIIAEYKYGTGAWNNLVVTSVTIAGGEENSFTSSFLFNVGNDTTTFQIRIKAIDDLGFTSPWISSATQNTGDWKVLAGTVDNLGGGNPKKVSLITSGNNSAQPFAVSPVTGDVVSYNNGAYLVHYDVSTGQVRELFKHGTSANYPCGAGIQSCSITGTKYLNLGAATAIQFDRNGLLYVRDSKAKIYQIDLENNTVSHYAGGGSSLSSEADARDVTLSGNGFSFDKNNNLYVLSNYTSSQWKIYKIAQNIDKSSGAATVIAGNSDPLGSNTAMHVDVPATSIPLPNFGSPATQRFHSLASNNDGTVIAITGYNHNKIYKYRLDGGTYKVTTFSSPVSSLNHIGYNPFDDSFYATRTPGDWLVKINFDPSQSGNNTSSFIKRSDDTFAAQNCHKEGTPFINYCLRSHAVPQFDKDGEMYFTFNTIINSTTNYQVHKVDKNTGKVVHVLGRAGMYGVGKDASVLMASAMGIFYKKPYIALDPDRFDLASYTDFPEGLYFTENKDITLNRIDLNTGLVHRVAGDGSTRSTSTHGGVVNEFTGLGVNYSYVNGKELNFDSKGFPIMGWNKYYYKLGLGKVRQNAMSSGTYWSNDSPAGTAHGSRPHITGSTNNLVTIGDGIIMLGSANSLHNAKMRYYDILNNTITEMLGLKGAKVKIKAPDSTIAGDFVNLGVDGCIYSNGNYCYHHYNKTTDTYYFKEYGGTQRSIRYIKKPLDLANATLHTLGDNAQPGVTTNDYGAGNITVSPDGTKFFQIASNQLHCTNIIDRTPCFTKYTASGGRITLPSGMSTMTYIPNQFTWKDDTNLIINTGRGYIYQFTFPAP